MCSEGYIELQIEIGSIPTTAKLWVLENLCTGIILGLDWLAAGLHKASIDFDTNLLSISFNEKKSSIPLLEINMNQHHFIRICDAFTLSPMEEKNIEVKISNLPNCDTAQFIPTAHFCVLKKVSTL
ncbi:unnamed protein product [Rotaria socialis]|uniref:Uncharacterized protein n=1 Tax=Rotaria socialis TaxID=392032 RepID=A0A821WED7_9BILA|nr:unnamed protein product [Rotaria socialis]CAF4718792.1 unnamed protein product [Rotaria socialis]CAF4923448.1 unnamed protein product [Rotaria socialis]